MEFFKELNIVEILKAGAIGLGFLLALMSYFMLKKEQERTTPDKTFLKSIKTFMVFSLAILILGIFSEFIGKKSSLSLRLGNNELKINELSSSALSSLDPAAYFISSEFGFAMRKPNKNWSEIKAEKGYEGLLNVMQIKGTNYTKENFEKNSMDVPFGMVLKNATMYYFENTASKSNLSFTSESYMESLKQEINDSKKIPIDSNGYLMYDTTTADGKEKYVEYINSNLQNIFGFESIGIRESFVLSIYPKEYLPSNLKKLKLPGLFIVNNLFGAKTDKLVASEKQILIGQEEQFYNVLLNNQVTNIQNKQWMMYAENEKYFFVIQISYCPQISSSTDLWDDLQEYLNSFTLIVN